MNREDFLKKLSIVAPALSDNAYLPVLQHLWMTGEVVMAFNDRIAISAPFKSEFIGAVPGALLIKMLGNSIAKDIDLMPKEDELVFKSRGNASFKLATMAADAFIFDMPVMEGKILPVDAQAFLHGIAACLISVGTDTGVPDQLGVTLIAGDGSLEMFSTNNSMLSRSIVPVKGKLPFKRVIVPTQFCQQMLRLVGKSETLRLEIMDDHALLDAGKGVMLFGRLGDSDGRIDWHDVLDNHIPKSADKQFVKIPSKLDLILKRAVVLTESSGAAEQGSMQITVQPSSDPANDYKIMKFDSKSIHGEAHDSMQVGKQHPNVTLNIEPRIMAGGYENFKEKEMLVTDQVVIMAKGEARSSVLMMAARSTV